MEEPYWWYIFFVKTNTERRVINDFYSFTKQSSLVYEFNVFILEAEQYFRNQKFRTDGKIYRKRLLFPGYVFIETNMPAEEFKRYVAFYVSNSTDVIRLLQQGRGGGIALSFEDRCKFEYLFKNRRCLTHSEGYIENDKIVVTMGPLIGREGLIKHINISHTG